MSSVQARTRPTGSREVVRPKNGFVVNVGEPHGSLWKPVRRGLRTLVEICVGFRTSKDDEPMVERTCLGLQHLA